MKRLWARLGMALALAASSFSQIQEKQLDSSFTGELIRRDGSVAYTGDQSFGGFDITDLRELQVPSSGNFDLTAPAGLSPLRSYLDILTAGSAVFFGPALAGGSFRLLNDESSVALLLSGSALSIRTPETTASPTGTVNLTNQAATHTYITATETTGALTLDAESGANINIRWAAGNAGIVLSGGTGDLTLAPEALADSVTLQFKSGTNTSAVIAQGSTGNVVLQANESTDIIQANSNTEVSGTLLANESHYPPVSAPSAHATRDIVFQDTSDTTLKLQKSTAGGGALIDIETGLAADWTWVPAADLFVTESTGGDWETDIGCGTSADTLNTAMVVMRCDDTTSEAMGFEVMPETGLTNIVLRTVTRAQTTPGGTVGVQWSLTCRTIADNSAVGSWATPVQLTVVTLGTNTNWQIDESTVSLSSVNLTGRQPGQCAISREPADSDDTLVGDATFRGVSYRWE